MFRQVFKPVCKENPYHEPKGSSIGGEFAHAPGGESGSAGNNQTDSSTSNGIQPKRVSDQMLLAELYRMDITSDYGNTYVEDNRKEDILNQYKKVMGDVSPSSILKYFQETLVNAGAKKNELKTTFDISNGKVTLGLTNNKLDETRSAQIEFDYHKEGKDLICHVGYTVLPLKSQGKNLLKEFMANRIEHDTNAGVSEFRLLANINIGGYSWAQYGFKSVGDKADNRSIIDNAKVALKDKEITSEEYKKIEGFINDDAKLAPRNIAAMKTPTKVDGYPNINTVGKAVLIGTVWTGYLRPDDKESMSIFHKYVGK